MLKKIVEQINLLKTQQNSEYDLQKLIDDRMKDSERNSVQSEELTGLHFGIVVSTEDPLKQGGVRFYTPFLTSENVGEKGLPWAYPISPFGGFDDSGCIWVPPAGSRIAVLFFNGDRYNAYYFGTIWNRNRGIGSVGHFDNWNYAISEYECLFEGRRNGYLVGSNLGDQVYPPWNTEMYNGYDQDSISDFYKNPGQFASTTFPYVKGFKTEQKHMLKFVEGDPRCNRRFSRVELATGRSNTIIMKDDHLHPTSQYGFSADINDITFCHTEDEFDRSVPKEFPCCDDECTSPTCNIPCELPKQCLPKVCPSISSTHSSVNKDDVFSNPFYKRYEEMRVHWGANTPQANKCNLPQSGIQIQSLSGNQIVLDDSVNQPKGVPSWDLDFDFGCDDICRCRMFMKSSTGHMFEINDTEDIESPRIRGEENGVHIRTASGNFFSLSDHTIGSDCEPRYAGDRSGATISTRSSHLFQLNDSRLRQFSPIRAEGGIPERAAEDGFEGYVLLRSGYGLTFLMKDQQRQDVTDEQFILLMAPQKDNERGPHMFSMQEQPEGPGFVILRAGGAYFQSSYDQSVEVVGVDGENQASKYTTVTDNYFIDVKNVYMNKNKITMQVSDQYIFLLAGNDCASVDDVETSASESRTEQQNNIAAARDNPGSTQGKSNSPCVYNAIVSKDPWVCPYTSYVHYGVKAGEDGIELDSRSERIYLSGGE